ncbi:hypothetical protein [Sinorhizobium meliloti]|uniref:hypothetical protein n=1 Tax=Rhizobium meliloti TaxID=382 RepID=UPI0019115D98|nr:hypothetical protein [Sinorhizobium meliloti]
MSEKLTLAQRVVRAICELGDTPDPEHADTLLVKSGDLEAIIDNHLEDWLIKVYDPPQPRAALSAHEPEPASYAEITKPYHAALRMIREAIETIFGPAANLESEEAELLRGPEPHHTAEAIIAALQNVASLPRERGEVKEIIAAQVQSVCDWDDRTSPDDYPDHLLITPEELTEILENVVDLATTRIRSCLLDKPEAVEVVGRRDALIERLMKALEAAETYVIDGVTTAKQNLEMNAAYPARKPRYEAELQEARDIYDECQAARRAALAAAKDKP